MRLVLALCVMAGCTYPGSRVEVAKPLEVGAARDTLQHRGWKFASPNQTQWRRIFQVYDSYTVHELQYRLTLQPEGAKVECIRRLVFDWRTGREQWVFRACSQEQLQWALNSVEDL